MKRTLVIASAVASAVLITACSDSGPDTPPALDRIDGPAQVDPSFDPFATVAPTAPGETPSPETDDGG